MNLHKTYITRKQARLTYESKGGTYFKNQKTNKYRIISNEIRFGYFIIKKFVPYDKIHDTLYYEILRFSDDGLNINKVIPYGFANLKSAQNKLRKLVSEHKKLIS